MPFQLSVFYKSKLSSGEPRPLATEMFRTCDDPLSGMVGFFFRLSKKQHVLMKSKVSLRMLLKAEILNS